MVILDKQIELAILDGEPVKENKKDVIRETDADTIALTRSLMHIAQYSTLSVIEPEISSPLASRVSMATDVDGT